MIHTLLQKAERLLKTDIRYLIKGSGVMMIGQVAISFIALATSVAFANLISKEAYGTYQYILGAAELLLSFSLIGIGRSVLTSVARGHDGALDTGFKKGLLWGSGALLLGLCAGIYYYSKGNTFFALSLALGTALLLIIATSKIYISFFNAKKLFVQTSSGTVIGILVPGIVVIATLLLTQNIYVILFSFLGSSALVNFCLFLWSRRYVENNSEEPTMMQNALHLTLDSFIVRIASQLDRLLLFQFAGPVILAEFWLAQNVERQFNHLFKSANSIALPKLSTRRYAELQESLPRKILFLYALIVPFTILYIVITPFIFQVLFPQYLEATLYAQVLGLLLLFLPLKTVLDVFIGHSMHHALYRITLTSSACKIAGTLALVPLWGIWGVIIAMFVDQIVHALLVVWYFVKSTPEEIHPV